MHSFRKSPKTIFNRKLVILIDTNWFKRISSGMARRKAPLENESRLITFPFVDTQHIHIFNFIKLRLVLVGEKNR
jgi:hypothetical protein